MTTLVERGLVALMLLAVLHAATSLSAPARLDADDDDVRLSLRKTSQGAPVQLGKKGPICTCTIMQKHSCVDWLNVDRRSGIRTIYVFGQPITVYCDQTTDNGGWIVFQRRIDASTDFFRNWTDYRNGFGDMERNFWLGDSLSYHRGQQFSTKDRDHDSHSINCAQHYHGAWWYKACHVSNLNGEYKTSSGAPSADGMNWDTFGGVNTYSMKFTEMKIRPI